MNISATVKAVLNLAGKKQNELLEPLEMGSKQSLSNKILNQRWDAKDLIKVAELCDCTLAFVFPDGKQLPIH